MTQQDVIEAIIDHPGITQKEVIEKLYPRLSEQSIGLCIVKLEKWGKIKRVRKKWTYALFLV